ncbi:MAG: hypothetical protein JEZ11_07920 [Desulfobacterales bacterium]|nr:hypothetical protein [Desulfobacterales bacterium]
MGERILLVEPGYKTKFPPMGLMKISAYHKNLGHEVTFVKGINEPARFSYWDKIYISTLFTFNWKETIDTIWYYFRSLKEDSSRIAVGGILATLLKDDLMNTFGFPPIPGVLDKPGMLGFDDKLIVDEMIPDYTLFDETPYEYTLIDDCYFGYSTRGCVNSCEFCGVPILEPEFIEYRGLKPYVNQIKELYGEKHNLVLFDNNVLASKKFKAIINDIIDLGFGVGAKLDKRKRHVDFNQGIDARLMTKEKVRLLSKIAIHPLRIAFDHIKFEKLYRKKVLLAAGFEIRNLSNYILYNFDDTPEDLWKRLEINITLNEENDLKIYSFPMKYIPLTAKDRSYINEPNWNWQFIRGVQRILNVLKGTVMTSRDFFYRAFGESTEEFIKILHMPEELMMSRGKVPGANEIDWNEKFTSLTKNEKKKLLQILCKYRDRKSLNAAISKTKSLKLKNILEYYRKHEVEDKNFKLFE